MLHVTMPTSFDPRLLDGLEALNARHADRGVRVTELFGSLPRSTLGVGRPTRSLAPVDRAGFEAHARDLQARGFSLTYLFNGSCSANREFDPRARRRLLDELEWVADLGTRSVVVASPYLMELLRSRFPALRIHVSSVCAAKSLKEVDHYARLGAARLILDPDTVRELRFIRAVRRAHPDLELEALANHPCLMNCPYEAYCYNSVAHGSADDGGAYEAFSLLRCNLDKLRDPAEFVRGSWFRPQDAHLWEEAGVGVLKLAGRGRSTEWLLRTAEAYLSRHYDGNMLDLIWEAQWTAVQRSLVRRDLPPFRADVPAAAFDGFAELFAREAGPRCREGCGSCRICPGFAARAVTFDPALRDAYQEAIEASLAHLVSDPAPATGDAAPVEPAWLAEARAEVDGIDARLLELLASRAAAARRIGEEKRRRALPLADPSREERLVEGLAAVAPAALDARAVRNVFDRVVGECRRLATDPLAG